jgi:SAM-dependent methyltransferase
VFLVGGRGRRRCEPLGYDALVRMFARAADRAGVRGTDAIQFPDEPASAYEEIRRVLKPGGRAALTCWEPLDRNDERLSPRIRRANLGAGRLPGSRQKRYQPPDPLLGFLENL